jgi:hypothetical protein
MSVVPPPMSTIMLPELGDRQPGADRRRHAPPRSGAPRWPSRVRAVLDGAALDLRDLRRHADDDARAYEALALCAFLMK